LEHVPEDESFVRDAARLVRPGGHVVLTCDFRKDWKPGDALPPTDVRFFTVHDLEHRLVAAMEGCRLFDRPDWGDHEADFHYGGCCYSFATFTVMKS
jgi:SAM-dependent methyltransferase